MFAKPTNNSTEATPWYDSEYNDQFLTLRRINLNNISLEDSQSNSLKKHQYIINIWTVLLSRGLQAKSEHIFHGFMKSDLIYLLTSLRWGKTQRRWKQIMFSCNSLVVLVPPCAGDNYAYASVLNGKVWEPVREATRSSSSRSIHICFRESMEMEVEWRWYQTTKGCQQRNIPKSNWLINRDSLGETFR